MERRKFIRLASLAASAAAIGTFSGTDLAFGRDTRGKTFIKVFMRGGADGLHLFPRTGDDNYYRNRPDIAIPRTGTEAALKLQKSAARALNPNLEPLMQIWDDGGMMISPSTGFPENQRSHFDAQKKIGSGSDNINIDGYMNRYLQLRGREDVFAGAVLGKNSLSAELTGTKLLPSIESAETFQITSNDYCSDSGCAENELLEELRRMSNEDANERRAFGRVLRANALVVDSMDTVAQAAANYKWELGKRKRYSQSPLGKGLQLAVQLLDDGVPLEVASIDWSLGWDMHTNQIAKSRNPFTNQRFARNSGMFNGAQDLLTFYKDLKVRNLLDNTVILVCTEFGRTIQQNGSLGTDHGYGGGWFMFGGRTKKQIASDIDALPDPRGFGSTLEDTDRYIPNVINYKDIVAEIMVKHLGLPTKMVADVLPGWRWTDHRFLSA